MQMIRYYDYMNVDDDLITSAILTDDKIIASVGKQANKSDGTDTVERCQRTKPCH